jgi:uncharacterized protein (DUF488 family)
MIHELVTIGVYGFTEEAFFAALLGARVDAFCDVRRRRGLRGSEYAFANSRRLQNRLAELGIRYLHVLELAPDAALRQEQAAADRAGKVPRRQRSALSPEFARAYQEQVLERFDAMAFLESLSPAAQVVALFCVEGQPEACHRSLAAEAIGRAAGLEVRHLLPSGPLSS